MEKASDLGNIQMIGPQGRGNIYVIKSETDYQQDVEKLTLKIIEIVWL